MGEVNLKPSADATKEALLRRASLDATGLPPNEKLINTFLKGQLCKFV